MLAIVVAEWKSPRERRVFRPLGFLVFALLASSWFAAVIERNPHLCRTSWGWKCSIAS
jgi:hypothetical protein